MSVAIIAQGGAVLGYLARNAQDARAKELCIPSFVSVLFGITEPALFGVNLRYRYPIIGGCIGGAIGGAVVYFTNLAALGFGTTVVPGIALADPANNGYLNYVIAHVTALAAGFIFTVLLGAVLGEKKKTSQPAAPRAEESQKTGPAAVSEEIGAFAEGSYTGTEKVNDPTFSQKILGDGAAIVPEDNRIYAPADAVVEMVADTKHAVALRTKAGNGILLHVGIDTVQLGGKYFTLHVSQGQSVKKGDCLMEVDFEKIAGEGYDTTICLIFAELAEGCHVEREAERHVAVGDKIAVIAG